MSVRRLASTLALSAALATTALVSGCNGKDDAPKAKEATAAELVAAGLASTQQGNQDAAFSAFKNAAEKDPTNVYAHYNLGTIYQARKQNNLALQEYGLALENDPKYVPALFNSATIYAIDNPQLAITTYRQVIKLQPKAPTAYLNLGLLEAKLELWEQAGKDLNTALQQDGSLVKSIPKDVFKNSPTPAPKAP